MPNLVVSSHQLATGQTLERTVEAALVRITLAAFFVLSTAYQVQVLQYLVVRLLDICTDVRWANSSGHELHYDHRQQGINITGTTRQQHCADQLEVVSNGYSYTITAIFNSS